MENPEKTIHLVSFNIPYPPDYGGVMDVFYKIRALKNQGAGVILHCFSYGRSRSRTLENECLRVHYYHRNLNLFFLLRSKPFIVLSRRSEKLLENLLSDDYPILFEGLHTTYFLDHPSLAGRVKVVRTHNVEHHYYRTLARAEKNPFRKLYYNVEAARLEKYEPCLSKASLLMPISPGDTEYFRKKYGKALFIGPFHPYDECISLPGTGKYVLLHGDFSTAENNAAALYLIREVISKWTHQTIIAGKKPSAAIFREVSALKHVKVIPNPSDEKMSDLIMQAQICILHATQRTGMKLKLINALHIGRHIIASEPVVAGTRLEGLCSIARETNDWINLTNKLIRMRFPEEEREKRNILLYDIANNRANAGKVIDSITRRNVHI